MNTSLAVVISCCAASAAFAGIPVAGSYTFGGDTTPTIQTGPWNLSTTGSNQFSVLRFAPTTAPLFSDIDHLSYSYDSLQGGISQGTPRAVFVLSGGGTILCHWGPAGTFVDPTIGTGLSTGNLMALTDIGRWDLSGNGGSGYTDYNAALTNAGSETVLRVSLVVDTFSVAREYLIHDVNMQAVPTPGAVALLGLGGLTAARRRR